MSEEESGNVVPYTVTAPRKLGSRAGMAGQDALLHNHSVKSQYIEQVKARYAKQCGVMDAAPELFRVAILSWIQIRSWLNMDSVVSNVSQYCFHTLHDAGTRTFALRVSNDAMFCESAKGMTVGSVAIIDPDAKFSHGSIVLAESAGEFIFRELVIANGKTLLKPKNSAYPTVEVLDDTLIIGVVKGVVNKL